MKRWKKGMAWLLSVLCILVTVQIPSIPAKAETVINFDEKIAAQRAKFPAGKYWNHWLASGNNPDGYTDHACTNHSGTGDPDCNLFDGAIQCLGYAFKTYYDVYGQHYNASPLYDSIGEIQVGDIVTVNTGGGYYGPDGKWYPNQHTIFVIGRNGDTLTVTECNALGDPCKIYWDTTYTVIGNTLKDNKYSGNVTYEFANGRHKPADVTFDTNQDPVGDVNEISCEGNKIYVRGWTYDPDTPNESLQVHIYVGQPAGTPGKNADIVINADKPSQDVTNIYGVGGNHRFEQSFETSYTGRQTVYIYAINSKSGNNPLIKQGTVDITQPTSVYITDFGAGGKRGSVSDTNATLYATATTNARSGINIGVRIGTSSGNWDIANINGDELSAAGYNQLNSEGYFEMWYECNTELGKTLKPGTTYYYQFFVKVNGKEYPNSISTFKTTDTIPLTKISLNKEELKLEKGASETLQVNYTPADTTDSKETLWSSSEHSVATVENGVVTAVGKGNALITARCGRYTATCKVSVSEKEVTPSPDPEEKPLEEIALNQTLLELEQGESESLTVSYKPEDTTDNKDIIWSSNDETVATVSDGVVTAVGKGTTVITAKVGKCEATCTVNVSEKQVQPSPSEKPSPSEDPTPTPSEKPEPSEDPTPTPSEKPSPSEDPTPTPSEKPSPSPSEDPTPTPSEKPSPSEDPTPAPSESPKPEVHPNVPAVKPVDQHTHSFSWTTVQKASTIQDGLEELRCSCGMVKERSTIPASQAYVNELYQNLGKAPENGEVSFDSGRIYTISDYLIKKFRERADVTTTITFEYNRTKYRMIIPAGADYTEMLEDEDYFYGYFYFAQKVGAKVETL